MNDIPKDLPTEHQILKNFVKKYQFYEQYGITPNYGVMDTMPIPSEPNGIQGYWQEFYGYKNPMSNTLIKLGVRVTCLMKIYQSLYYAKSYDLIRVLHQSML